MVVIFTVHVSCKFSIAISSYLFGLGFVEGQSL